MSEKIQRDSLDILIDISDEEERFRRNFLLKLADVPILQKCTVCSKDTLWNIVPQLYSHPVLGVTVCFRCYRAYDNALFIIHNDGTDTLCRWCGRPAQMYDCSKCTCKFCRDCLERNFGQIYVESIDNASSEWRCFICYPKQVWGLRAYHIKALNYRMEECETIMRNMIFYRTNGYMPTRGRSEAKY